MMFLNKVKPVIKQWRSLLYSWNDYRFFAKSLSSFQQIVKRLPPPDKGALLIVSGRGMNVLWSQIWTLLSLAIRIHGYRGLVLTTHSQKHLNRYYKLLKLTPIFFDDLIQAESIELPEEVNQKLEKTSTFEDYHNLFYKDAPIGQIALSTYSRYHGTGIIDLSNSNVRGFVKEWIVLICQAMHIAEMVYEKYNVQYLFFTEVFMEEYGAFYYTALSRDLNIIRFAGTVRDDSIIVQHLTRANDRIHHASLSKSSWEKIKQLPYTEKIESALNNNFLDRYGNKWHRSKRNHPNTKIVSVEDARKMLNIATGRKVAVIYSHILYDTLFFFGTDLFNDYAEWLIETVRVACQNTSLDWLVKVHPSNLWRGELDSLLRGKYEEDRLIEKVFGELPSHVRIIPADIKINPYTWFQLADFGITVRGTSGLEMAALGKTVITAGTGRYEGNGFTIDPPDKLAYIDLLMKLPNIPMLSPEQVELAKRYAYSIFVLKPFPLSSLKPVFKTGVRTMRASDDLIFCCNPLNGDKLPSDLLRFSEWAKDSKSLDMLAEWGIE